MTSGGCSPVNWLSQTRINLTINFLNLNFANRKKLCKNSAFHAKISTDAFILRGEVFIFLHLGSFLFCMCIALPSLSYIDIDLWDSVLDLKI